MYYLFLHTLNAFHHTLQCKSNTEIVIHALAILTAIKSWPQPCFFGILVQFHILLWSPV